MALQAAFAVRRVISSLVGISALLAAGIGSSGAATAAEPWPANLHAVYDINFNGFNVGTFDFQSQAESQSYTLTGNARLSVLLGAFKWDGETRSFGLLVKQEPKPASFTFDFKSTLRSGSTKMGFSDGAVTNVTHLPPAVTKSGTIPV